MLANGTGILKHRHYPDFIDASLVDSITSVIQDVCSQQWCVGFILFCFINEYRCCAGVYGFSTAIDIFLC